MKDQVDALWAAGVSAAAYNSSLEAGEARRTLARLHSGELDLLYVAPETLMTESFLTRLREIQEAAAGDGLALFAIDEAHCVSQWGHDFRPEYVQLGQLRGLFPGVPIIACTATADPQTRDDVRARLRLSEAPCYVTGFDRPNIRYTVVEKREPLHQLQQFLAGHTGEAGIIYCLSRKRTEEVAGKLRAHGVSAAAYHAGLPAEQRRRVQDAFAADDVLVVVATVAFGMGIDKSNVRFVVHYDLPKTVESYYQETGRSGRDGLPAEALLLFGLGDAAVVRSLIEGGGRAGQSGAEEYERDPERVRIEIHKLNVMVGYADGLSCRREALLGYFGEPYPAPCGNCDICLEPPETFDATEQARMALSCVYRLRERDGFGYGVGYVIDVLRGSENEKILARRHDELSTFGIGAEQTRDHWQSLIRQLIHRGYLTQDIARFSALRLTEAARPLLRGEQTLVLAKPRTRVPTVKQRRAAGRSARAASLAGLEVDKELFERLRALRKRLADAQRVPAYVVFSDAALAEMAARKPHTPDELLEVNGVGQAKLQRYGAAFLVVIAGEEPGKVDGEAAGERTGDVFEWPA